MKKLKNDYYKESEKSNGSPGFELIILLGAIIIFCSFKILHIKLGRNNE